MYKKSSTNAPPRRHHHHQNFPPQQYTDLRGSDISLLAPLFGPTPPRTSVSYAAHEEESRKGISKLPSHLKIKIALLSSFCSVHKQLNYLPIQSILSFIQNEVSPAGLSHWAPVETSSWLDRTAVVLLEEMNAVWQAPKTFQSNYGRPPNSKSRWTFVNHKCAGCKLSEIANNVPAIEALGACVLARLDPANWKKSKRIQWFENWLAAVGFDHQTETVTKAMWQRGVELRNAMGSGETPSRRAYIDDFVAQTRTPQRPARSETQDGHVAFVADTEQQMDEDELSETQSVRTVRQRSASPALPAAVPSTAAPAPEKLPTRYVPSTDFFARVQQDFHDNDSRTLLRPASHVYPAYSQQESSEDDIQSLLRPVVQTPSAPRRPTTSVYSQPVDYRVASSIYSRATDEGDDIRWDLAEDEFIDSYCRSSKGMSRSIKPNEHGFI